MGNAHNRGQGIDEALSRYSTAKMKFAVVASDKVMTKFVTFDRLITSGEKIPHGDFDRSLGNFMMAARLENLGNTKISGGDLVIVTPFGKSIRISNP